MQINILIITRQSVEIFHVEVLITQLNKINQINIELCLRYSLKRRQSPLNHRISSFPDIVTQSCQKKYVDIPINDDIFILFSFFCRWQSLPLLNAEKFKSPLRHVCLFLTQVTKGKGEKGSRVLGEVLEGSNGIKGKL